jgi:hypothetical protein
MNSSFVMMKCNILKLKKTLYQHDKNTPLWKKCQPLYHIVFVFMVMLEGTQIGYL